MHHRIRLSIVALAFAAASCGAKSPVAPGDVPTWVSSLIQELATQPRATPPASVLQYQYRGEVVFYVPPRCCDIPGMLFNVQGQLICQPDGGFTGRGDGRCPDFLDQRRNERLIWRDPR